MTSRLRSTVLLALAALGCTRDDWRERRDAAARDVADVAAAPDIADAADVADVSDVPAAPPRAVTQVLVAANMTFALTRDGSVYAAGKNAGAFEGVERSARNTFTRVEGLSDVAQISLASLTPAVLCARRAAGTVACKPGSADAFDIQGLSDARQIAGRCALRASGEVACWTVAAGEATPVPDLADVVSIAGNGALQCALTRGGSVWCWGEVGAVMDVPPSERVSARPEPVARVSTARAIGVGRLSACAALASGSVVCWGRRSQIDLGPDTENTPAAAITGARGMRAVSSNAGLREDGAVMVWASGASGTRGDGSYANVAAAGEVPVLRASVLAEGDTQQHVCAADEAGALRCWGLDDAGELGRGGGLQRSPLPALANPAEDGSPTPLDEVVDATLGAYAACALRRGGVWCWGSEENGLLGNGVVGGSPPWRLTPTQIPLLGGVTQLLATGSTPRGTFGAVLSDGTVRLWGSGANGALGDGSTAPRAMPVTPTGLTDVTKLVASLEHLCALRGDRTVRCWGRGDSGELGDGAMRDASAPVVAAVADVVDLTLGPSVSVALLGDGSMRLWGLSNSVLATARAHPTPVALPPLADVTQLAAVMPHDWRQVCALRRGGRVSCIGDRLSERFAWVDMGLTDVTQIAGSPAAVGCARHGDGTVSCWGINRNACLGDPALPHTDDYVGPTRVRMEDGRPLDGVTVVRPGIGMVCAVRIDGTLWCWGANANAVLARGAVPYAARPVLARGL